MDLCVMVDFTPQFAARSALDFLGDIVVKGCQARYIVCGEDFHFGAGGVGDVQMLTEQGRLLGFDVKVCEPVFEGDNPIRSTRIRQCLLEGKVEEALQLLGHHYMLMGRIGAGDRRGRQIGYPTANLEPSVRRLIPHHGVYAARASVDDRTWNGMMNIGTRPTFSGRRQTIEIHLFDFSGDLYEKTMSIDFIARIREEKHFSSIESLIEQLQADEATCRALLRN
jgi:riboflavin kinase/FMN adenylyltransferase